MYMAIIAVDMSVLKYPVHRYVPGDGWGAARVPLINSKSTFQFVQDLMKLHSVLRIFFTDVFTHERQIWDLGLLYILYSKYVLYIQIL